MRRYVLNIIGRKPQNQRSRARLEEIVEILRDKTEVRDRTSREEFVDVGDGRSVLAMQIHAKHGTSLFKREVPWTLVHGYKASEITYNREDLPVVECEGVPEDEQPGVTEVLRQNGFKGPLNYNS